MYLSVQVNKEFEIPCSGGVVSPHYVQLLLTSTAPGRVMCGQKEVSSTAKTSFAPEIETIASSYDFDAYLGLNFLEDYGFEPYTVHFLGYGADKERCWLACGNTDEEGKPICALLAEGNSAVMTFSSIEAAVELFLMIGGEYILYDGIAVLPSNDFNKNFPAERIKQIRLGMSA